MRSYEIYLNDWSRIFFGEVPAVFYIELVFRTAFVYLLLMVSMRAMGKRLASQLSRNEMVAMVSLAAAIGVPILSPDRGLLPAVIIAFIVVSVQRIVSAVAFGNEKFQQLAEDDFSILVEDGLTFPDRMVKTRISEERLFAQLRCDGIDHLGQVERLYLEAGGKFTLIMRDKSLPGLSVMPEYDADFRGQECFSDLTAVCGRCGNRKKKAILRESDPCERCGKTDWQRAVRGTMPEEG